MTANGAPDHTPTAGGSRPVVDMGAILAQLQEQVDDLTAIVEAQQRTIDELLRAKHLGPQGAAARPAWTPPAGKPGKS